MLAALETEVLLVQATPGQTLAAAAAAVAGPEDIY